MECDTTVRKWMVPAMRLCWAFVCTARAEHTLPGVYFVIAGYGDERLIAGHGKSAGRPVREKDTPVEMAHAF